MFGNQRPVAPWTNHHWWGQYDSPAELPNVAGARLQLDSGEVQAGDMAWSLSDGQLYVCIVGTAGAALWNSVFSLIPSSETTNLYVAADAATADDSGPGTIAEPLATLDEALRRTNRMRIVTAPVIIHMAAAAAGYTWSETLGPLQLFQPVAIVGDGAGQGGDGFTVLRGPSASAAGTGQRVIVDPAGGMTVNAFQGKTIEILSGAAAGDRRTIRNNTATDIVPAWPFSEAVAPGDTFRIVEPAVDVAFTADGFGGGPLALSGVGTPAEFDPYIQSGLSTPNLSSVLLSNLRCAEPSSGSYSALSLALSQVYCAGVEIDSTASVNGVTVAVDPRSQLTAGFDRMFFNSVGFVQFELPETLGMAGSDEAWVGWGISFIVARPTRVRRFAGFMVAVADSIRAVSRAEWLVLGGAFRASANVDDNGFMVVDQDSLVYFWGENGGNLPVQISANGSSAGAFALMSSDGARVGLQAAEVICTGNGVAVLASAWHGSGSPARGPGTLIMRDDVTLSGVRVAAGASYGGRVSYDDAPTLLVAPSQAEAAVWQGTEGGVPTATSTFAGLADGASIINTTTPGDGSCVMRVT